MRSIAKAVACGPQSWPLFCSMDFGVECLDLCPSFSLHKVLQVVQHLTVDCWLFLLGGVVAGLRSSRLGPGGLFSRLYCRQRTLLVLTEEFEGFTFMKRHNSGVVSWSFGGIVVVSVC